MTKDNNNKRYSEERKTLQDDVCEVCRLKSINIELNTDSSTEGDILYCPPPFSVITDHNIQGVHGSLNIQ